MRPARGTGGIQYVKGVLGARELRHFMFVLLIVDVFLSLYVCASDCRCLFVAVTMMPVLIFYLF